MNTPAFTKWINKPSIKKATHVNTVGLTSIIFSFLFPHTPRCLCNFCICLSIQQHTNMYFHSKKLKHYFCHNKTEGQNTAHLGGDLWIHPETWGRRHRSNLFIYLWGRTADYSTKQTVHTVESRCKYFWVLQTGMRFLVSCLSIVTLSFHPTQKMDGCQFHHQTSADSLTIFQISFNS